MDVSSILNANAEYASQNGDNEMAGESAFGYGGLFNLVSMNGNPIRIHSTRGLSTIVNEFSY